jgi:hypothetical protein
MSATPGTFEADEFRRLRRLARIAILLAVMSTVIAVAALVAPYNAALRAYLERVLVAKTPTMSPQLSASVVEAERFVVRRKGGQVRAELGVQPDDDRTELSLRAPNGTLRATLSTADAEDASAGRDAATLGLYDPSGTRFAALRVIGVAEPELLLGHHREKHKEDQNGSIFLTLMGEPLLMMDAQKGGGIQFSFSNTDDDLAQPTLYLVDHERTVRTEISLGPHGMPLLALSDQERKASTVIGFESGGEPLLKLSDQEGKGRTTIGLATHGEPALTLADKEEKLRMGIGLDTQGEPLLTLFDREGKERAVLGSTQLQQVKTGASERTAESSLVLFDKEGRVIFRAPFP